MRYAAGHSSGEFLASLGAKASNGHRSRLGCAIWTSIVNSIGAGLATANCYGRSAGFSEGFLALNQHEGGQGGETQLVVPALYAATSATGTAFRSALAFDGHFDTLDQFST